ncbi:hypothetical protein G4V62_07150 [Bacillaceae bacterium SIJ1]|uniref:YwmB family TATA-box binding protein n=1 Tax=Litoribacterium kuwaitense TaxID=1398745 RepID=UPI0013E9C437|nr:YwmB family TATA-box binding protein [Litoribacterium kuwaitense]NGP44742.1 hypothetical protein [Litoribacterium kuwaitense]
MYRSKVWWIALILAFCVLSYTALGKERTDQSLEDTKAFLNTAFDVMVDEDVKTTGWSLYSRKTIMADEERLAAIKRSLISAGWVKSPESSTTWQRKSAEQDLWQEQMHVKKHRHTYMLSYELKSSNAEKDRVQAIVKQFASVREKWFSKNTTIYACLQGQSSAMISGVLSNHAASLLRAFDATPVEMIEEQSFISVSAYNDLWEQHIVVPSGKMNLQTALRKNRSSGVIDVTIGTPIITVEY